MADPASIVDTANVNESTPANDPANMNIEEATTNPDEVILSTKEAALEMAVLVQHIAQLDRLFDKHYTGDKYLDPILDAHLRDARTTSEGYLDDLQAAFPGIEPDLAAVKPLPDNFADRSEEIDVLSTDPHHLSFAIALLRNSYRTWKLYAGNETRLNKLSARIDEEEKHLQTTKMDNAESEGFVLFNQHFSRAYNLQATQDFIYRMARDVVSGNVYGEHQDRIAEAIACLANHDFDNVWNASDVSTYSGKVGIRRGAEDWLDGLKGSGLVYQLDSSDDIDPREYWYNLGNAIRLDPTEAKYEKIYIGALLLAKKFTAPCVIGYIRLVFDFLVCEHKEPLNDEQALVVARLIQLLALIDRNGEGHLKVERDTEVAFRPLLKSCISSEFIYMEFLAACRRQVSPQYIPITVYKHPEFPKHKAWECDPHLHQLVPITLNGNKMVLVRSLRKEKHTVVPLEELSFTYKPRKDRRAIGGHEICMNVHGGWGQEPIIGACYEDFEKFEADVQAWFPGVKVECMS